VTVAGSPLDPASRIMLYGHIASLTRTRGRFELRFDPALWLTGFAAARAAREDTGSPVAGDYYIVDESHRLLTYVVSDTARVLLLDKGLRPTPVPVAELAQILAGRNPRHRPLFTPGRALGFWIRVGPKYPNPVVSLEQQYQP